MVMHRTIKKRIRYVRQGPPIHKRSADIQTKVVSFALINRKRQDVADVLKYSYPPRSQTLPAPHMYIIRRSDTSGVMLNDIMHKNDLIVHIVY